MQLHGRETTRSTLVLLNATNKDYNSIHNAVIYVKHNVEKKNLVENETKMFLDKGLPQMQ